MTGAPERRKEALAAKAAENTRANELAAKAAEAQAAKEKLMHDFMFNQAKARAFTTKMLVNSQAPSQQNATNRTTALMSTMQAKQIAAAQQTAALTELVKSIAEANWK